MKISLNMIYTKMLLSYPLFKECNLSIDCNDEIDSIRLLPKERIELSDKVLYVCDNDHPIIKDGIPSGIHIICIGKSVKNEIKNKHHIFLSCNEELALFLYHLQEIYLGYKDWYYSLERMVIEGKSVQEIIECAEDEIDAPMVIYDPSLKVIGISKIDYTKDEIFNQAKSLGYLPMEFVDFFQDEGVFKDLNYKDVDSMPKAKRMNQDHITKLQKNGVFLGSAVLLLLKEKPIGLHLELFSILCQLLKEALYTTSSKKNADDYFLSDILNENISDVNIVKERTMYMGIPYVAHYSLFTLMSSYEEIMPKQVIIGNLSALLPKAMVFSHMENILILIQLKDLSKEKYMSQVNQLYSTISNELQHWDLICTVSKSFTELIELPTAYKQCLSSYKLTPNNREEIYYYDNVWLNHMISICSNEFPLESFCEPAILKINRLNTDKSALQLLILKSYLENNCQSTKTAELLHMHRNNIVYHIKRLENQYNLELDNSDMRLHLLISLKVLDFINQ